jgi:hypothetical protein
MSPSVAQLPYIEHGKVTVPDSTFIIRYLTNTYPEKIPNLTAEQETMSTAATAILETRFVMGLGMARWLTKQASVPMFRLLPLHNRKQ